MLTGLLLAIVGFGSAANCSPAAVPASVLILAAGPVTAPATDQPEEENPQTIDYWSMLFVFVLATFIGLGVIGRVSRLLHTPLMSLTNAISAIAIVGAIVVAGSDYPAPIRILGAVALFASMTNIVSGFLITDRMLKMFRQTRSPTSAAETGAGGPSPSAPPAA
jgi:H+-translocating NAD(P) transhydrogenase subunit alpha